MGCIGGGGGLVNGCTKRSAVERDLIQHLFQLCHAHTLFTRSLSATEGLGTFTVSHTIWPRCGLFEVGLSLHDVV